MPILKKTLIIVFLVFVKTTIAFSQTQADDITGYYLAHTPSAKEPFQVEFFRVQNGTYEARVVWIENPDFRSRLEDLHIRNLSFNSGSTQWQNGRMTFEGREYRVTISFTDDGRLRVRGFFGISLLGRTMYWTREQALRES